MRQCGLLLMLCSAWAFADPDVPDPLMVPDASVGQGGAQQGNEESDTTTVCTSDKDCDRGLKCDHNKCTWQQYRQATFSGCGGRALAMLAVGLVLAGRRRSKRGGSLCPPAGRRAQRDSLSCPGTRLERPMEQDVREELAQLARTGQSEALMARLKTSGLGADVTDHKGDGLLMVAAYNGSAETVTALLLAGAEADRRNSRGLSALDGASFKGDLPVIEALLAGGAQVDATGPDGKTALMWAAAFDRAEAVKVLMRHGASSSKTDSMGNKASVHALNMGAARAHAILEARE